LWPPLGAVLDREGAAAAARVRTAHGTRHRVVAALLGYTDAVLAGRRGAVAAAETAFAAADAEMGPLVSWYRQYARRLTAEAALTDGWGDPVKWLREAAAYFAGRGDDRIAAACRGLLRDAGAPVPRQLPQSSELPAQLRALGVTGREAEVLGLVARGLANREIAEQMFLSPRTVEKHVASLLAKTGTRRRAQLAGYFSGLAT
jgi:DNA-binding CsgD family transcriptional regulator